LRLEVFFQESGSQEGAVPVPLSPFSHLAICLGFNSHLHVLAVDGCFYGQGMFRVTPPLVHYLSNTSQPKIIEP
jgi:hypothetical protein